MSKQLFKQVALPSSATCGGAAVARSVAGEDWGETQSRQAERSGVFYYSHKA